MKCKNIFSLLLLFCSLSLSGQVYSYWNPGHLVLESELGSDEFPGQLLWEAPTLYMREHSTGLGGYIIPITGILAEEGFSGSYGELQLSYSPLRFLLHSRFGPYLTGFMEYSPKLGVDGEVGLEMVLSFPWEEGHDFPIVFDAIDFSMGYRIKSQEWLYRLSIDMTVILFILSDP